MSRIKDSSMVLLERVNLELVTKSQCGNCYVIQSHQ